MKKSNRRIVVFSALVTVLTLTSALLLALAPAPLRPDASSDLLAIDSPESMDVIFQTQAAIQSGRWKYIYIHQSHTSAGNALSLGQSSGTVPDHFVIGNGDGALDGQIQVGQRWDEQNAAAPPPGATGIDSSCISICLIGDFDHSVPTPNQIVRLTNLVKSLQGRFDISQGQVVLMDHPSARGIGRYFPTASFHKQLLP